MTCLLYTSQGGAVGRGHVDDGVNAVDEEEKGQQVQENMLLLPNLPEGASQLSEGGENGAAGMLHEGGLTDVYKRQASMSRSR